MKEKLPFGLIGANMEDPEWNDPGRLVEFRGLLNMGQVVLAERVGVTQGLISQIENGIVRFTEPTRTRIWTAIFEEMNRQTEENAKKLAASANEPFQAMWESWQRIGLFKSTPEQEKSRIELLKAQRDNAIKECELLKKLVDMDLVARVCQLEKELADARQQLAEYGRLFHLEGDIRIVTNPEEEAAAAAEGFKRSQEIERRVKGGKKE